MAAPATPDAVMLARTALRAQRGTLVAAIDAFASAQAALATALRSTVEVVSDPNNAVTKARQAVTNATNALNAARTAEGNSRTALAAAIATWLKDGTLPVTPTVDIARLLPSQAIIMFPARLETRYSTPATTLRVRVYPDELSLDTHERALTLEEEAAGKTYYTGLSLTDAVEEGKRWQILEARFGAPRAAYIARVMRPFMHQDGSYPSYAVCDTGWTNEPASPTPQFPVLPHRPDAWTRPAEAVLPDRWVLVGYRAGQQVLLKAGLAVPEPLPFTIDPGGGQVTTAEGFLTDPDLLWSTDFTKAESIGMAFTIGTNDDANVQLGYDRLVVVGVKSSLLPFVDGAVNEAPGAPPPDTATYLERLFDSHHYTRGLAIVPQGTATNNTEGNPTSFPPDDPFGGESFKVERQPPPFHRTISYHCPAGPGPAGPDIDSLSRILGVPNGVFTNVFGARELIDNDGSVSLVPAREQDRARLMNAALWPATWGYFLEQMMDPIFAQQLTVVDSTARPYFIDNVRGRGPAPAFRVGGVPYGVLPAVSLDLWHRQIVSPADTFEEKLVPKLRILRDLWKDAAAATVTRLPPPASVDPWPPFVSVMGQQASSRQIRIRNFRGPDAVANQGGLLGVILSDIGAAISTLAQALGALLKNQPWQNARVANLVMDNASDVFADPLVTSPTLPDASDYIFALARADLASLRDNTIIPGSIKPLLYLLVRHSYLIELQRFARLRNLWNKVDNELHGFPPPISPEVGTFFEMMAGANFDLLHSDASDYRLRLEDLSNFVQFVTDDEVERIFTETLDVASHRLDAWITAVATRRLRTMRQAQELAHGKPAGSYLGGYGWVENLRPNVSSTASNGGYIHAPSMPQAAAAALLRSSQQSGSAEAADKYSVDLSSERVRNARRILDEIRQGQQLGAVLGYRFERALRDKHTDLPTRETYIIALRRFYPLVANKSQTDVNLPADQVAARNVVDGVLLRAARATIPFGTGGLPAANSTGATAILAEVDALDQLADAVGDLLTAESVYQLVRGNVSGTGATLDTLSRGLRPPDPEIARSPRGGVGVTHRIAFAFTPLAAGPTANEPPGWSDTPSAPNPVPERIARARNLDRAVGRLIGDPTTTKAVVAYRVGPAPAPVINKTVFLGKVPSGAPTGSTSLGLRPLDLVVLARATTQPNQGSLLDRRIIDAAISGVTGATDVTVTYDAAANALTFQQAMEVARAVGVALVGTRPLLADDLVPPAESSTAGATPTSTVAAEATALLTTATSARTVLFTAKGTLDQAIATTPPSPARTASLRTLLRAAATYDPALFPDPLADAAAIDDAATVASAALGRRVADTDKALAVPGSGTAEVARAALAGLQAVFGRDFVTTQTLSPTNATELVMSLADRAALLPSGDAGAPLQMLEQASRVRESLGRARRVALYTGALGMPPPSIAVTQVPFVKGETWAGPRPSSIAPPPTGRVSCLFMVPAGGTFDPAQTIEGLLLDEWTELVPGATEETGLAFHYDNPGAEAPQAVLAAVPAAIDGKWTFAQLLATVNETLDLAHIRMVEPEHLRNLGQALPAIYVSQHGQNAIPSTEFTNLVKDPTYIIP
jgi:hypothetical protein